MSRVSRHHAVRSCSVAAEADVIASSPLPFAAPLDAAPSPSHSPLPRPARSAMHASAEVYGFCLYVSTFIGALLYLAWALLPDTLLHSWGITYYPSKYWALALPAWGCSMLAAVPLVYFLVNMTSTLPLDHTNLLSDGWTTQQKQQMKRQKVQLEKEKEWEEERSGSRSVAGEESLCQQQRKQQQSTERYSIPDVLDIPLERINQLLYSSSSNGSNSSSRKGRGQGSMHATRR